MFFVAAISFLAGVIAVQQGSALPGYAPGVAVLGVLGLVFYCWPTARRSWLLLGIGCFTLGVLWAAFTAQQRLNKALPAELVGNDLKVSGYIASIPEPFDYGQRFEFVIDQQHAPEHPALALPFRVRLNWYQAAAQAGPALRAGDYWQLQIRLKPPRGLLNPGGFDYAGWLFGRGIRATGYVRASEHNQALADSSRLRYALPRWRQALLQSMQAQLPTGNNRGIIQALALGHRADIHPDDWQLLLATGTNHLIAISGLHIGLIAGLMYWLVMYLGRRVLPATLFSRCNWPLQRIAAGCGLGFALLYAALAGFALPTQRALIMLTVGLAGFWAFWPVRAGHGLALALIAVVVWDPWAVNQAGFWLSFGAVAIILYALLSQRRNTSTQHATAQAVQEQQKAQEKAQQTVVASTLSALLTWLRALPPTLAHWGYLQAVLILGLLPLTLFWFDRAAVTAAVANMLAIPLVGFCVVPLVLLGTVCSMLLPVIAGPIYTLADSCLNALWPVLHWTASWPFANWQHSPPLWTVILALVGVGLLLAPRGFPARWLGIFWLLPLFNTPVATPDPGDATLTVLDVGQGTAAVVRTQQHVLVYDTGPKFSARFDAGHAVVLPYLRTLGVTDIDMLMVSHGDNDHIGGAESIVNSMPVKRILSSVPERIGPQAEHCLAGQRWQWDGVDFVVLHPQSSGLTGNNASCVLRIATRGASVLLTGDIEYEAEQLLLASNALQPTDIVLVPHHGSRTSSTEPFVAALQAKHAVFSAGFLNRYGFPKPDIAARYQALGAKLWTTGTVGAIEFYLDHDSVRPPLAYRDVYRKYWTE